MTDGECDDHSVTYDDDTCIFCGKKEGEALLDEDVMFTAFMGCKTLDEAERKALDMEEGDS